MTLETSARKLIDAIAHEKGLILALTGAGVSVASGIPTFRGSDPGAIWTRDVREMATIHYFRRNPVSAWQWYRARFASAEEARPNSAHTALAAFERWHIDRGGRFLLVTQNIDSLHEQAGSIHLAKVHGSANRARCSREECSRSSTRSVAIADLDLATFDGNPRLETIPRCAGCGGLMRPHVLFFDEEYIGHTDYQWPKVTAACDGMRLVVAVGTSLSVGVTDFVQMSAGRRGVPLFIVEPGSLVGATIPDAVHVRGKAEEVLPMVMTALQRV